VLPTILPSRFYCFGKILGFQEPPPPSDGSVGYGRKSPILDTKSRRNGVGGGSFYYVVSFVRGLQRMFFSFVIARVSKGIGNNASRKMNEW